MSKNFQTLYIFTIVILLISDISAQEKSGIITYKGIVNQVFVDSFLVEIENKNMSMATKQGIIHALKNPVSEEFILNFKNDESYYHKKPDLEHKNYRMGSRAGTTPYYTNISKNEIIEMSTPLGYIAHETLNWNITNRTKKIGDYKCYLATVKEKLYSRQGHYYYRDTKAWFTPEIPLNFGPKHYKGLPGLILQIEEKEFTLTATKINLNPEKEIKITRIDKDDKVITQEESYNRIKELMADRKKRMSNNK